MGQDGLESQWVQNVKIGDLLEIFTFGVAIFQIDFLKIKFIQFGWKLI